MKGLEGRLHLVSLPHPLGQHGHRVRGRWCEGAACRSSEGTVAGPPGSGCQEWDSSWVEECLLLWAESETVWLAVVLCLLVCFALVLETRSNALLGWSGPKCKFLPSFLPSETVLYTWVRYPTWVGGTLM